MVNITPRKSSLEKLSFRPSPKNRSLSIEHLTKNNLDLVFRANFLGSSPTPSPTREQACEACAHFQSSITRRESMPQYKRHAVILPIRHSGMMCQIPSGPLAFPVGEVGEGALLDWEREGASLPSSPNSSRDGSPATTPSQERSSPGFGGREFSVATQTPCVSRFSTDTIASLLPEAEPSRLEMMSPALSGAVFPIQEDEAE